MTSQAQGRLRRAALCAALAAACSAGRTQHGSVGLANNDTIRHMYVYIYIYIYIHTQCVYIYIYIYM